MLHKNGGKTKRLPKRSAELSINDMRLLVTLSHSMDVLGAERDRVSVQDSLRCMNRLPDRVNFARIGNRVKVEVHA